MHNKIQLLRSIKTHLHPIIHTTAFQRLRLLSQLGFAHYEYPGATHTRFEHSLATLDLTLLYLESILRKKMCNRLENLLGTSEICCVCITALIHDIGHTPFRHDLKPWTVFESQCLGAKKLLQKDIELAHAIKAILTQHKVSWDEFYQFFIYSFDPKPDPLKPHWYGLAKIINGPIDADKLSYLTLDCLHSGKPFANALDHKAIIADLMLLYDHEYQVYDLVLDKTSRISAEFFAVCRYAMFETVYWNQNVRSVSAVMRRACTLRFNKTFNQEIEDTLLSSGDFDFITILKELKSAKQLIDKIQKGFIPQCIFCLNKISNTDEVLLVKFKNMIDDLDDPDSVATSKCRTICEKVLGHTLTTDNFFVDFPCGNKNIIGELFLGDNQTQSIIKEPGPLWNAISENFKKWIMRLRFFTFDPVNVNSGTEFEIKKLLNNQL